VTDPDADELMALFRKVVRSGKHVAIMAHFNHPRELQTDVVQEAISRIRDTGAEIRTQSPLLSHINDDPSVWAKMWREQVNLGCVPYYMFLARDTGAQHYFGLPLVRAHQVFNQAVKQVSGLARTVRGPSMSCTPGKVQVLDVTHIRDEKVIALNMIQGRDPDWVGRVFFADYDEDAVWLDDLKPAFGKEQFFFEE
jgi:L-lysine 2,3-aminomutase